MAIPLFTVGEVLTASLVNNWLAPLAAYKSSDESVTSSTTLQNDDDLVLAVAANCTYFFQMYLHYSGAALGTGDVKVGWSVPASATMRYQANGVGQGGGTNEQNTYTDSDTFSLGTNGSSNLCGALLTGTVAVAGTAGNMQFRWSQNTSSGTASKVRAQSCLIAQRVS